MIIEKNFVKNMFFCFNFVKSKYGLFIIKVLGKQLCIIFRNFFICIWN